MSDKDNRSSGIGFVGLLAIAFIVLKLVKVIDWSWWWVLSPLWIWFAFIAILLIVYLMLTWIEDGRLQIKVKRVDGKTQSLDINVKEVFREEDEDGNEA